MNAAAEPPKLKCDLDSPEQIARFVDAFYDQLLQDPVLAPLFLDVAAVELEVHKPHIVDYWCKLLLGDTRYQRHTMNIHRRLHGRRALQASDFERWVGYFQRTVDECWEGEKADRAKRVARTIADNMHRSFS